MEIFLTVALPIFALICSGYGAHRLGLLTEEAGAGLDRFVYYFALPVLLFDRMASAPANRLLVWPFLGAYLLAGLAVYGLAFAAARYLSGRSTGGAALDAQGAVFGNVGYIGLPLAQAAAGKAALIPMAVALTLDHAFFVPLTLALLAAGNGRAGGRAGAVAAAVGNLARNPLVVAILAGALLSATGFALPPALRAFAALLGGAAGPCALFAVGAALARRSARGSAAEGGLMTVFKLGLHPLAMWVTMNWVFDVQPMWASVAVLAAALPLAEDAVALARRFGDSEQAASTAFVLSTLASLVTVSAALAWLFTAG
jgi:predicted permease